MRITDAIVLLGSTAPVAAQAPCGAWHDDFDPPTLQFPVVDAFTFDAVSSEVYVGIFHATFTSDIAVYRRTGTVWAPVGPNILGRVRDMAIADAGFGRELLVSGSFDGFSPTGSSVLRWTGSAYVALPSASSLLGDLASFDDGSGPAIFATATAGVLRYQGGAWASIGSVPAGSELHDLEVHDAGSGPALYLVGRFASISGVPTSNVARWNGTTWSAVGSLAGSGPGVPTPFVRRLLSARDEAGPALFALGAFQLADGMPANGVARFDGSNWIGLGQTLTGVVTTDNVGGLALFDAGTGAGPRLVVSSTTHVGLGNHAPFCAEFDGSTWLPMPTLPGGQLFTGGPLLACDLVDTPGADLIVSRALTAHGAQGLSHLEACDLVGQLFCFGDGSQAPCPCGNESSPSERAGCRNSSGTGGALRARGDASLVHDLLRLDGSGMTNNFVLYFQAANQHAPTAFGDGLSCTGGPFVRLGTKLNASGASTYPEAGDVPISVRGGIVAPGTRRYQARYRNSAAFCTSATFNYTSAVTIVWSS